MVTARQPRRARRRAAPAAALPRPTTNEGDQPFASSSAAPRPSASVHHREHHVTKDYSHVHRDLLTVLAVGTLVLAFIVGMSFVVS